MPREARQKSSSGMYHILFTGNNRIFRNNTDYERFLGILNEAKSEFLFTVYGYALFENHIHLAVREGRMPLSNAFRSIGAKYVKYYHNKYKTSGKLFSGRYKSEVIRHNDHLTEVIKYIHQNSHSLNYPYSSYTEYSSDGKERGICDINYALFGFSNFHLLALKNFLASHSIPSTAECIDINQYKKLSDDEADKVIYKFAEKSVLKNKTPEELSNIIMQIRNEGVSIRQLSRLTGLGIWKIQNANKYKKRKFIGINS